MGNEHHNALPPGYQLENYRLDAVLGHGGFGITYRASDEDLEQVVAIKEYLPREVAFRGQDSTVVPLSEGDRETFEWGLERFLDEARTLARFGHPNIVGVHRFLRANGTAYLVMDYCEGESLESMLAREGTLAPDRLEAMLVPLLNALDVLHAAGVTHRDIKPGNIYLREDGSPVLLDFGAARQALAQHSRSVTAMATPGYAAFEQYSTKGKQGPWTDIYGLGATLYRCVTGQRPPDASDRMLKDELVPAEAAALGPYPRPLLQQIDVALGLRPDDRPQSVAAWRRVEAASAATRNNGHINVRQTSRDTQEPNDWGKATRASGFRSRLWKLIIPLLVVVGGVFWLATDEPNGTMTLEEVPWKIEVLSYDHTRVLGIELGRTTLRELAGRLPVPDIRLFVEPDGTRAVEAFYANARIPPFEANLVLVPGLDEAGMNFVWEERTSARTMPSGARRYGLSDDALRALGNAPVVEMSYVPRAAWNAEQVRERFGEPANQLIVGDDQNYWLYPDRGLAILIPSDGGRALFHYVILERWGQVRARFERAG